MGSEIFNLAGSINGGFEEYERRENEIGSDSNVAIFVPEQNPRRKIFPRCRRDKEAKRVVPVLF